MYFRNLFKTNLKLADINCYLYLQIYFANKIKLWLFMMVGDQNNYDKRQDRITFH